MKKGLRWKVLLALAVLVGSVLISYPIQKKIKLGLDLKGGIHLVLQVLTEDALNIETDQEIVRLEDLFKKRDIVLKAVAKDKPGQFTVQGINPDQEGKIKELLDEYYRDWNYTFIGDRASLSLKPNVVQYIKDQSVNQALETIRNRVDQFGVSEPIIQRQGGERIIVELPGVENPERVQNLIKTTALLEWKLVKAGPAPDEETLLKDFVGKVPEDMQLLRGDPKRAQGGYYLVSRVAAVTGKDLRNARRSVDEWNNPAVSFSLNADGARRFEKVTGENIGKPLAIILDGKVQSAPTINARISDSGIITGRFSLEEAEDLAVVLRAGALPAGIKSLENRTIGPSLGVDSIRSGLLAGLIAIILVMTFMIVYYKLSGANAIAALILNVIILFGALAYFKASLTLPGIAGIILSLGMAVDANVLIFERIREERALGKTISNSISLGFSRAFSAIFDSNLTTVISAVFLFQFGTGPIKGYAITLIIGLAANMFTAVFVSHLIFDLTVPKTAKRLSI